MITAHGSYLYCEQLRWQRTCGETTRSKDSSYEGAETKREKRGGEREKTAVQLRFC